MADTSRIIRVIFDGTTAGLNAAAAAARRAINSVNDDSSAFRRNLEKTEGFTSFVGGMLRMSATAGIVASALLSSASTVAFLGTALAGLAPGLLAAPGLILGVVSAIGVFKLATSGFSKALTGDAKALAALSPAARSAAQAVISLKPAFGEVKRAVQDKFFDGFNEQIKLSGNVLLPVLKAQLPAIASGFNAIGLNAIQAVRSPFFTNSITGIFQNTAVAVGNMKNTVASAATGFVGLGNLGSQYLPRIGTAIDNVALRFEAWVKGGLADGSLQRFIDKAILTFHQLTDLIGNIGSTIGLVFQGISAGLTGGGGALSTVRQLTASLREFFATAAAQQGLKALGEVIQAVADAFRGVLLEALIQITPVVVAAAPALVTFAQAIGSTLVHALQVVGPLLLPIANFLSANPGLIKAITPLVLGLAAAFLLMGPIASIISGVGAAITGLGIAFGVIAGIVSGIAAIIGVLGGFGAIFAAIGAVITAPVTLIVGAIALIIGAFVLAYNHIQGFRDFVDGAMKAVGEAVSAVGDFFFNLPDRIGTAVTAIGTFFSELPGKVLDFIVKLPEIIVVGLATLVGTMARIGYDAFTAFINASISVGISIVQFVTELPGRIGNAIVSLGTILATNAINAWHSFLNGTVSVVTNVITFIAALPGRIGAFLAALPGILATNAVNAWTSYKNATIARVNDAIAFVRTLPQRIVDILLGLVGRMATIGSQIIQGIINGMSSAASGIFSYISDLAAKAFNAAKAAFGVHSPSILFKPIGFGAGQGIGIGFSDSIGFITSKIRGLIGPALTAAQPLQDLFAALFGGSQTQSGFGDLNKIVIGAAASPAPTSAADSIASAVRSAIEGLNIGVAVNLGNEKFHDYVVQRVEGINDEVARRLVAGAGVAF